MIASWMLFYIFAKQLIQSSAVSYNDVVAVRIAFENRESHRTTSSNSSRVQLLPKIERRLIGNTRRLSDRIDLPRRARGERLKDWLL